MTNDELDALAAEIKAADVAAARINYLAQAQGRKAADDWDAYMVESLRGLGKETGQVKHYEKKISKYLKDQGY